MVRTIHPEPDSSAGNTVAEAQVAVAQRNMASLARQSECLCARMNAGDGEVSADNSGPKGQTELPGTQRKDSVVAPLPIPIGYGLLGLTGKAFWAQRTPSKIAVFRQILIC